MTLLYVLIGLAVVYAAFAFGRRKQSNYISQTQLGNQASNAASHEGHQNHKGHGCC